MFFTRICVEFRWNITLGLQNLSPSLVAMLPLSPEPSKLISQHNGEQEYPNFLEDVPQDALEKRTVEILASEQSSDHWNGDINFSIDDSLATLVSAETGMCGSYSPVRRN